MNKIIVFVLLLFNGIGIIFSQENYLPSTTPYLPGEKTDEFFKYYTISKLKVNKYILDSEIDDYAHTPNLFDLSKPIPNPGKGVIDYIFDNYISVDICGHKIIDILNEDVYKYFNLNDYNTPLKKQFFEASDEFKNLKIKIKNKKLEIEKSNLIIHFFYEKKANDVNPDIGLSRYLMSDYDLKRGGFTFRFNLRNGGIRSVFPKNTFCYWNDRDLIITFNSTQLPLTLKKCEFSGEFNFFQISCQEVFLPFDKETAFEIENNPQDLGFFFIALDKIKKYKIKNTAKSVLDSNVDLELLSTDRVKLIALNTITGKIYFEKIYEKTVPKK